MKSKIYLVLVLCIVILMGCGNEKNINKAENNLENKIEYINKKTLEDNIKKKTKVEASSEIFNETEINDEFSEENIESEENKNIVLPDRDVAFSMISVKNVMSEDGKHGGAVIPSLILKANGNFEFTYGSSDEYFEEGTYTVDGAILTLNSTKGNTYVFNGLENGLIKFNSLLSSEIIVNEENAYSLIDAAFFSNM